MGERWTRIIRLQAPSGFAEHLLYMAVAFAGLVSLGLLVIVPVLFVGCGPSLCGFFW
jgi:hypothetical protein